MITLFEHGYAVVAGIAGYPRLPARYRLPPSVSNDAVQIARVLWEPERCAYPAHQVKLLCEEGATAEDLRAGLRWLASETDTKDTAVFYYSGHGWRRQTGAAARNCLTGYDAGEDRRGQGMISGDELTELLDEIPAGRLVVFLDCCYAAGIGELRVASDDPEPFLGGLEESFYDRLSQGAGRVIVAATMAQDLSYAPEDLPNSLFTHHLLAALRGEAAVRPNGLITIFDLFDYISDKMALAPQRPIFKSVLRNNFPIALHCGGRRPPLAETDAHEDERSLTLDLLESLLERQFDVVLKRLDPQGHSRPGTSPASEILARRVHARNLVRLMEGNGSYWWSQLQETVLAAASPFSPADRWLTEWDQQPPQCWQKDDHQFVGLGEDPLLFPGVSPEQPGYGSALIWRVPRFRDALVETDLWLPTLARRGAAGLLLRYVAGHSTILGLLRHAPPAGAVVELWQRDGVGLTRLGAAPLPADGGQDGWYRLRLDVRGRHAAARVGDVRVAGRLHADLPAGHLALAKFADSMVRFRNLHLNVRIRE